MRGIDQNPFEFTSPQDGRRYQAHPDTGAVSVWIERERKASGWQRLKSMRRITRVLREATALLNQREVL